MKQQFIMDVVRSRRDTGFVGHFTALASAEACAAQLQAEGEQTRIEPLEFSIGNKPRTAYGVYRVL